MRADKTNVVANMSMRQKITVGVFILVIIFLGWQLIGLFRGSATSTTSIQPSLTAKTSIPSGTNLNMVAPKQVAQPKQPAAMTQAEIEMLQRQQQMEAQYIAALNELQVLRLSKEIAETNEAIAKAKLETVTAQKNIVSILTPPPVTQTTYSQALTTQGQAIQQLADKKTTTETTAASYSVISVSQIQNKWSAVIGYQGVLYQVSVGDILPPDQSTVISINQSGIVVQKDGVQRKISLVSII